MYDTLSSLWYYFRLGHANYLNFTLNLINTILIIYHFGFATVVSNMYLFSAMLLLAYIPVSILAGRFHMKHQYHIEVNHQNAHNRDIQDIKKMLEEIKKRYNIDKTMI